MKRLVAAAFSLLAAGNVGAAECVVLLHGLGRTPLSMKLLQRSLQDDGYLVWNRGYPSTDKTIEELSSVVGTAVADCRSRGAKKIHFVTHSMGGLLVRAHFQNHRIAEAGRVVMLAPPNHGSEIVDAYGDRWWFRAMTGPAGQQLGTGKDSLPNRLAQVDLEIGIIAGSRSSDPWFGSLFTADHDGKVSVESAALPEMKDFLLVESGHTFMMNSNAVIRQVKTFLRTGAFDRGTQNAS